MRKKSTKEEHLLKKPLGKIPNVPVVAGNVREENLPFQPTSRRATLARERKIMQAIQEIGRLVTKNSWCMALDTLQKSVKYSRDNLRSTPHNGPKRNTNPPEIKCGKYVKFD